MKKIQNKLIFFIGLCVVVFGVTPLEVFGQFVNLNKDKVQNDNVANGVGIFVTNITYSPVYDDSGKKVRIKGNVKFTSDRMNGAVPRSYLNRIYLTMDDESLEGIVSNFDSYYYEDSLFNFSTKNDINFNEDSEFEILYPWFNKAKSDPMFKIDNVYLSLCLKSDWWNIIYLMHNCSFSSSLEFGKTTLNFQKDSIKLRRLDLKELQINVDLTYKNEKQSVRSMVPKEYSENTGFYGVRYSICKKNGDKSCLKDINLLLNVSKAYFNVPYKIDLRIPEHLIESNQDYVVTFFQNNEEGNSISKEFNYSKMMEVEANEIEFSNLKLATEDNDIVKLTGSLVWNNPQKEGQVLTNALNGITIKVLNHEGASMGEFGFSPVVVPGKYGEMLDFSRKISVRGIQEGRRITIVMQHENAQPASIVFEKKADGTFEEYKDPDAPVERPSDIGGNTRFTNPLKDNLDTIPKIVAAVINGIILPITIPFFAIALIWSGFLYIKARGNATEIGKAHNAIKWTLIGGAVILGAYVIGQAVQSTVVDIISLSQKWYG